MIKRLSIVKQPILSTINDHLVDYPSPSNLNYFWGFGSLAGLCLLIQMATGIFLAMHYTPYVDLAFLSVEHIMRDIEGGWLLRYMYANGASMFFLVVYLHMYRTLSFLREVLNDAKSRVQPLFIYWSLISTVGLLMYKLISGSLSWQHLLLGVAVALLLSPTQAFCAGREEEPLVLNEEKTPPQPLLRREGPPAAPTRKRNTWRVREPATAEEAIKKQRLIENLKRNIPTRIEAEAQKRRERAMPNLPEPGVGGEDTPPQSPARQKEESPIPQGGEEIQGEGGNLVFVEGDSPGESQDSDENQGPGESQERSQASSDIASEIGIEPATPQEAAYSSFWELLNSFF